MSNSIMGTFAYHEGFRAGVRQMKFVFEKQIERDKPMKPIETDAGIFFCKACDTVTEKTNFCSYCGQRLDWAKNERD